MKRTHARAIDFNVDAGEGYPYDAVLLRLVSSVNIACGYHAGDDQTMARVIRLAKNNGVNIGAHVSYPDREGFGRRRGSLSPAHIGRLTLDQLRGLGLMAQLQGVSLKHCKLHGALYHEASKSSAVAWAVGRAIVQYKSPLIWIGMPHTCQEASANRLGIRFAREAFVDRRYLARGILVPRSNQRAVIEQPGDAVSQACMIVRDGQVRTISGREIHMKADTLCLHSDTPRCVLIARRLLRRFKTLGITVRPLRP